MYPVIDVTEPSRPLEQQVLCPCREPLVVPAGATPTVRPEATAAAASTRASARVTVIGFSTRT